jgi:hypothetical protein
MVASAGASRFGGGRSSGARHRGLSHHGSLDGRPDTALHDGDRRARADRLTARPRVPPRRAGLRSAEERSPGRGRTQPVLQLRAEPRRALPAHQRRGDLERAQPLVLAAAVQCRRYERVSRRLPGAPCHVLRPPPRLPAGDQRDRARAVAVGQQQPQREHSLALSGSLHSRARHRVSLERPAAAALRHTRSLRLRREHSGATLGHTIYRWATGAWTQVYGSRAPGTTADVGSRGRHSARPTTLGRAARCV